jgi:hypothetical protein
LILCWIYLYLQLLCINASLQHRYLWKVNCSRYFSLTKICFNKTKWLCWAQNKKVGWQGRETRQVGRQGSRAWSIDVPALTANIFSAATNTTNIHNKADSMRHGLPFLPHGQMVVHFSPPEQINFYRGKNVRLLWWRWERHTSPTRCHTC